jgi:hypothetical protein
MADIFDAGKTVVYFIDTRDAPRLREALAKRGVSYTDTPWQRGIRRFEIAAADDSKLAGVLT